MAKRAGIATPHHELLQVAVLLSRRFDRADGRRIPFLSAMALLGAKDGQTGSYPEMVDALARHGSHAKKDAQALYRRVAFNVLVSNVDDHLRNHGFLRVDRPGWTLSPAYDLNPVPADLKARVLTTNIDPEESTCSVDLLEASAEYFALSLPEARRILKEVAVATSSWRSVPRRSVPAPRKSIAWTAPSSMKRSNKPLPCPDRRELGMSHFSDALRVGEQGMGSKFVTDFGAIQQLSFKKLSRIFAPPFLAQ